MNYLLTIENPRHKLELLENGSITVSQKQINIEDPDWKITYSNLFGAPYERLDELLNEQLQEFGTIVGRSWGHYAAYQEVENGICQWWMLLCRPVLGLLQVGLARLSIKYEEQPDFCHKCHSFGHPQAKCQVYQSPERGTPPNVPTNPMGAGTPRPNPPT